MAHYVMSDIHGEADRFWAMLEQIRFSPEDTLYVLGDVVDRGPHGIRLLLELMEMPNVVMLLGNHEHMFLRYLSPDVTETDILRWNKNGNRPTLEAYTALDVSGRRRVKHFLRSLPAMVEVEVAGTRWHLVHGFPGDNLHDQVWGRPQPDTPNPKTGSRVVVGHTPVPYLGRSREEVDGYLKQMEASGETIRIFHGEGFIDIDCGCGQGTSARALACLRLEDLAEFYV